MKIIVTVLALALSGCVASQAAPEDMRQSEQPVVPEAAAPEASAEGAAPEAGSPEAAADPGDAPFCIAAPGPATGAVSDDCFAFDSCEWCGVPSGTQYWCAGGARGDHPALSGCVIDPGALSGYAGSCCPGPEACTRLSDDDGYCQAQGLGPHAFACSATTGAGPSAGCLPSGTTFDALGQPVVPDHAGAALSPAQRSGLYCCP